MSGKPADILLVEDDDNDIFLIQRAFRRLDLPHSLQIVTNGEDAINYLDSKAPDNSQNDSSLPALILLDLKLPRKSGLEVLAWIRQQPQLRRLLVVVLTASRETPDINRAYDTGANSYLVKPVNFHDFIEMIRTLDLYWLMFNEKPLL